MTLAEIRAAARAYFSEDMNPAHDWHHVTRVGAIADRLLAERNDADEFVVRAAVYLHDIGRAREDAGTIENHAKWGASEAGAILRDQGISEDRIDSVQHAVRAHRYSGPTEPKSIEARILSDADNLDALGAVGIARCFTYGGELGNRMYDPDLPPEADETESGATQYNHFYKKILDLPDAMHTQTGREMAEARRAFVETFLTRFDAEVRGER